MRPRFPRVLALVAGAALLAACSSTSSTTTSSSSGGSGGGDTIKVGIDMPLSGADASIGIPTAQGAQLAIEQAAKSFAGGKFKLEASTLDDAVQGKHDPAAGAQNVKTFISDASTLAMVGPFNSNVAQSEIPLTNDSGLVQIAPSTTNDGLTVGDAARKLRSAHPDQNAFFRVCTRDSLQGPTLANFAKKLGYKRAFVVDDNETYGKGLADQFVAQFQKNGGTVTSHEHITPNQQDFKALLTKAKADNPDVVFYGGTTSTGGGLVRRQMGDVGLGNIPYMGGDGISDDEFLKVAGDSANGTYFTVPAPDATKLASAKQFVDDYKKRYNAPVGPYSANAYTAAKIEIAAIEKAITDDGGKMPTRADVLKNVAATKDFPSPIGPITFTAAGDITAPTITLYTVKGGKTTYVDQVSPKA